jgi:hypothetical protein
MIEIRNINGDVIDSEMVKQLFVQVNDVSSDPITLKILNTGPNSINNVGVYLLPTTFLGEIDHYSNKTPDEFLNELLSLGSQDQPFGLKMYYNVNDEIFFSISNGSNKQNKVIIKTVLNANEFVEIKLKYFKNPQLDAEIIYVGVEAE